MYLRHFIFISFFLMASAVGFAWDSSLWVETRDNLVFSTTPVAYTTGNGNTVSQTPLEHEIQEKQRLKAELEKKSRTLNENTIEIQRELDRNKYRTSRQMAGVDDNPKSRLKENLKALRDNYNEIANQLFTIENEIIDLEYLKEQTPRWLKTKCDNTSLEEAERLLIYQIVLTNKKKNSFHSQYLKNNARDIKDDIFHIQNVLDIYTNRIVAKRESLSQAFNIETQEGPRYNYLISPQITSSQTTPPSPQEVFSFFEQKQKNLNFLLNSLNDAYADELKKIKGIHPLRYWGMRLWNGDSYYGDYPQQLERKLQQDTYELVRRAVAEMQVDLTLLRQDCGKMEKNPPFTQPDTILNHPALSTSHNSLEQNSRATDQVQDTLNPNAINPLSHQNDRTPSTAVGIH